MKRTQSRKYTAALLAILLGTLASVALATTLIDPYGQFGTFPSLNPHKAALGSMNSKVALAAKGDYRLLFIGSSRTGVGLDPDSPILAPEAHAFNFGLSGCGLVEMELALRFALEKNPAIDTVLIDIEPSYFSDLFQPSPDLPRSLLNPATSRIDHAIGMAVGFETLEHTAHTLRDAWKNAPPADTLQGLMRPQLRLPEDYNARRTFIGHFQPQNAAARLAKSAYDPSKMQAVESMLATCQKKNVQAVLYLSPVHATRLLWTASQPNHEDIWRVKRDLVRVAEASNKLGGRVRVYDFSWPRGENIEPVPIARDKGVTMTHYIDPVHFLPSVGNRVLAQVVPEKYRAGKPESENVLGTELNPQNVEAAIQEQGELLKQYAAQLRERDAELYAKLVARAEF